MDTQTTALHEKRLDQVTATLVAGGVRSVLDVGCGSGALLQRLLEAQAFDHLTGLEPSGLSLRQARARLAGWLEQAEGPGVTLRCAGVEAPDPVGYGHDAITLVEVLEHLDPGRLSRMEQTLFTRYRPGLLLLTTPNGEYNPIYGLAPGERRDPDHQFEWERGRFRQWATGVARRNGYSVHIGGIGEPDAELGHPTHFARFERQDG